jgi:hypothetical protein
MCGQEAVQLLQNKLEDAGQDGLDQLIKAVDCIPLPVVHAAAYINRLAPRMTVAQYLGQLAIVEKKVQLLQTAAPDMGRDWKALNSVFAIWQISFEHIRSKQPSVADLLSFMSFFNRQGIPEFIVRYSSDDGDTSQNYASDQDQEGAQVEFKKKISPNSVVSCWWA